MKLLTRPLEHSGLPDSRVTRVLINYKAFKAIKSLKEMKIETVKVRDYPLFSGSVASHADMSFFHYGNDELFCLNGIAAGEWAENFNLIHAGEPANDSYPDNVVLNCVRLPRCLICNSITVSEKILEKAYRDSLGIIDTKQGYTKCSVCVLNSESIITDDVSIYNSASKVLSDVTFVTKGSIILENMNYGFIGGCTGLIDKQTVAFNGRIDSHPDHNKIYDALARNGLTALELTDGKLEDIGSIIPINEKNGQDTSDSVN
jgi:hypothetical protein